MNIVAPCPVFVDTIVSVIKNVFIALIYIQGSNYDFLGMGPGPLALGKSVVF